MVAAKGSPVPPATLPDVRLVPNLPGLPRHDGVVEAVEVEAGLDGEDGQALHHAPLLPQDPTLGEVADVAVCSLVGRRQVAGKLEGEGEGVATCL